MLAPRVSVHLAPSTVSPQAFDDAVAIVIDAIRATSTITAALAAGAAAVVPCLEPSDAHAHARNIEPSARLLGGERGGLLIPGFDLGNSPTDYTTQRVQGKTILFTTTNGTRAIHHAARAPHLLAASFLNLTAVVRLALDLACADPDRLLDIRILCAGVHNAPCLDDTLLAGALADDLARRQRGTLDNDEASIARVMFTTLADTSPALIRALERSAGGQSLASVGLARDIRDCATLNTTDVVAVRTAEGVLLGRPAPNL